MKDDKIEAAIQSINRIEQEQRFQKRVDAWIRVRCMAAGSAIVTAMWQLGSWAVENMAAITAAVKAFLEVRGGR